MKRVLRPSVAENTKIPWVLNERHNSQVSDHFVEGVAMLHRSASTSTTVFIGGRTQRLVTCLGFGPAVRANVIRIGLTPLLE